MKILMCVTQLIPNLTPLPRLCGKVYDVPMPEALRMIEAGIAELAGSQTETQALAPAENAARPRPKRRKRK